MAKIKTSELTGAALDWAVAKCEGVTLEYGLTDDERYSTDWAQGGPIIEREQIDIVRVGISNHCSSRTVEDGSIVRVYGPTPLIAAMRCYVASKLGDEVDVPEELTA